MNLALLLIGLRLWTASTSMSRLTRFLVAVSVFSVEAQVITLLERGTIRTLVAVNAVLAAALLALWRPPRDARASRTPLHRAVPPVAAVLLGGLVIVLNLGRPFEAADPYHIEKMERIARTGTLAYDPATEIKINVLNSTYELLLADVGGIPLAGHWLVRLHGLLGLLLYLLSVAATREQLASAGGPAAGAAPGGRRGPGSTAGAATWAWAVMAAVPVVFHQLVLVKNDLFVAAAALPLLAWVVRRAETAAWREAAWASWIAGLCVAIKLTTLPLLLIVAGAILHPRGHRWLRLGALAAGSLTGLVAGGLFFTFAENLAVYRALMPVEDVGGAIDRPWDIVVGIPRFALSLADLGLVTRHVWPGRGGWGGTFALPLVWAVGVLIVHRRLPEAGRALAVTALCFLAFAAGFKDADLAHRLVLAPGLLLVATAVHLLDDGRASDRWLLRALGVVIALSIAQIARSAFLYWQV